MAARGVGVGAVIAIPVLIIGGLLAVILLLFGPSAQACGPAANVNVDQVPEGPIAGYAGEQLKNAAHIMNAASTLGLQRDAQVLGVMTAMGESSLRVLDYGDEAGPDSRGLFQQRDSWGTLEERMDPTISATKFFSALIAVADWQTLEPTIAAHRVQRNADPYHYEKFYPLAVEVVDALAGGGTSAGCQSGELVFPLTTDPMYQFTSGYGYRGFVIEGASEWHPAVDMQHQPNPCDEPIFAITQGTVTYAEGYQIWIKHPDGYSILYVHMYPEDMFVTVGDVVAPGQKIALVGTNGPSTGCHLHLGISVSGNTNEAVAGLPRSETIGGPIGYVNPEEFYRLFGLELCPADTCRRTY